MYYVDLSDTTDNGAELQLQLAGHTGPHELIYKEDGVCGIEGMDPDPNVYLFRFDCALAESLDDGEGNTLFSLYPEDEFTSTKDARIVTLF